ncbi:hypothetical protein [Lachnoclostridium sp. Marseille-P6806]|uniref:hypothetical protein n=1 Tax=Lachnoclostridium sp. Marseille-P6806 TaxID=2364793 RepID=UPI00102F7936|nr:hypothetical protein [Lachnoclostridium sp. Marseille-P6806]
MNIYILVGIFGAALGIMLGVFVISHLVYWTKDLYNLVTEFNDYRAMRDYYYDYELSVADFLEKK